MNHNYIDPLIETLKIPSISTQEEHKGDMADARVYLTNLFQELGFKTKILKGKKHDAVFAERITDRVLPTVLIYGHYDVQPPEPLDEWKTPPFEPRVIGDEIFARGSADNKGQHMIHIMAVKKLIEKGPLPVNFKFLIEGEEEVGSVSIADLAKKYAKNLFVCDFLMVSDTGMRKGQPGIDIGLRGLLYTEIRIQTAGHDLHSGEYGGVAENPVNLMAHIIAKLKDENNRVLIPGFYEEVRPLTRTEISEIKNVQKSKEDLMKEGELYGVGGGETKYTLGERKWTQPTLDVNGIWGGYSGEGSKTIIPASASAKISMRIVPNQDNDKIYKAFSKYVKSLLPKFVKVDVVRNADCLPYIAPIDDPVFDLMIKSLKKVYGKSPIFKRVSGSIGFVPIMAKALKVPVLMVGFALSGSNIHGANEDFSINKYLKGIGVKENFYLKLPKKAKK